VGIDGDCESTHEADTPSFRMAPNVEEAEARRRPHDNDYERPARSALLRTRSVGRACALNACGAR
jgi:hypothetical protein